MSQEFSHWSSSQLKGAFFLRVRVFSGYGHGKKSWVQVYKAFSNEE